MGTVFVAVFLITLIYFGIAEHIKSYIKLIALQGLLLFGLAIYELKEIDTFNLIFILLETLLFKTIFVPWFIYRLAQRNNIQKIDVSKVPGFNMVLVISGIILTCFTFSYFLHDEGQLIKFFTVAIATIITGLVLIIWHKSILTHVVSYLVIENGVFLLALAVGHEMPGLVDSAILLDVFTSILVIGIFFNKIGDHFTKFNSEELTELKD